MSTDLEVRTGYAPGDLSEEGDHDLHKLHWLHHVQNLLQFVQKHDLFGTMHLGPILEQTHYHLGGGRGEGERRGERKGEGGKRKKEGYGEGESS